MFSPDRFISDRKNFSYFETSSSKGHHQGETVLNSVESKVFTKTQRHGVTSQSTLSLKSNIGGGGGVKEEGLSGCLTYNNPPFGKVVGRGRKTASEPATPAVVKDRGLRPSDLSDPHKKEFLTNLTTKVFHLALDEDANREKIPLERLFTPATDSGHISPKKKKAFASSDFYAKGHPTIDDQLQLAQRISESLLDQTNKTSKGQAMYERRKEKSEKWIHQAQGYEISESESSSKQFSKPALKLVMNPKGVQDHTTVEQHYQQLLEESSLTSTAPYVPAGGVQIPASPEIAKDLINDMQSPTGKGAALFAKRKKRMDKFIVDETNVQKASAYSVEPQNPLMNFENTVQNQYSSTKTSSTVQNSSVSSSLSNKKKTKQERDKEQKEIMENLMKSRESQFKMVKTPWESVLETGSASQAFQKTPQTNPVIESAAPSLPTWMDFPKPVPIATAPQPPVVAPVASPFKPAANAFAPKPIEVLTKPVAVQSPGVKAAVATPFTPRAATTTQAGLTKAEIEERRKSVNFNLAAKGWGTFNDFYKPVSFAS